MKMSIHLFFFFAVLSLPNFLSAQTDAKRQHKPMSVVKTWDVVIAKPTAFDAFLKIEGVEGESKGGTIQIESWSFGASNAGSMSHGSGGGAGKASFQDLHFTTKVNKASPMLAKTCASGKHIPKATLFVRKSGGSQEEYYVVTLQDCLISSFQTGGSSGDSSSLPMESLSMNYSKIEVVYVEQDKKSVVFSGQKEADRQ